MLVKSTLDRSIVQLIVLEIPKLSIPMHSFEQTNSILYSEPISGELELRGVAELRLRLAHRIRLAPALRQVRVRRDEPCRIVSQLHRVDRRGALQSTRRTHRW